MKYSLECKVDSNMIIEDEITYHEKDKTFILIPDDKKYISTIKIVVSISDPKLFHSTCESYPEKREHKLTINMDKSVYEDLIYEFQRIESMLAFPKASLKKVYWESPKQEIIPETQEERNELKVLSTSWTKSYPNNPLLLNKDTFIEVMENRYRYPELIVPQAFFREGMNDFHTFRYISAFYNFYFVIEDLYGDRKCQNSDVAQELKKSNEFRSFVQWVIDDIQKDDKRHFNNISSYLNIYRKTFDIDGLIFIIVRIRGQLHHYSGKSTRPQGTPFNQVEFESFAYLTLLLAFRAISHKMLSIYNEDDI